MLVHRKCVATHPSLFCRYWFLRTLCCSARCLRLWSPQQGSTIWREMWWPSPSWEYPLGLPPSRPGPSVEGRSGERNSHRTRLCQREQCAVGIYYFCFLFCFLFVLPLWYNMALAYHCYLVRFHKYFAQKVLVHTSLTIERTKLLEPKCSLLCTVMWKLRDSINKR